MEAVSVHSSAAFVVFVALRWNLNEDNA